MELKGFERLTLKPGEQRTIAFTLSPSQLAFWNRDFNEVNEPGPVKLSVGNSSVNLDSILVEIV